MTIDSRPPTADLPLEAASCRRDRIRLVGVLAIALCARLIVMALWPENLTSDPDGYLALALGLAEGRGFSIPGTEIPTAYRPPLYPLTLVPAAFLPSGFWVAALHLVSGVATVWLTWLLAVRLPIAPSGSKERELVRMGGRVSSAADGPAETSGPSLRSRPGHPNVAQQYLVPALAALFVAFDPILLRYATLPMTETLATLLVTALLVAIAITSTGPHWRWSLLVGVLFGLAALCRPTVWAFAGLIGLWSLSRWGFRMCRARLSGRDREATENLRFGNDRNRARSGLWITLAAAAIVLLPWVVRNTIVLGHPIVMTTHGGYTLLLGNNPAFDREVVTQPWGTVWNGTHGEGQAAWVDKINRAMEETGLDTEVAQDRWMSRRARENILADPGAFARACWLRFRRFWGIVPVEGASDLPHWLQWPVAAFYTLLFAGGGAGLLVVGRRRQTIWVPPLLIVTAFLGVHLVYWTNTRMRAPILPVIAILSAIGWSALWTMSVGRTSKSVRAKLMS